MKFSWLHISDTHLGSDDRYDRDIVLRSLVSAIEERVDDGHTIDAIFATGDIASHGNPKAYPRATELFDELCRVTKLSRQRVFVVPGNHDINRRAAEFVVRTLKDTEASDSYFAEHRTKYHFERLTAYREWFNEYFRGIREFPTNTTCGPVETVEIDGVRVGIILINTALFCADDFDNEKLWIGRRCFDSASRQLRALAPNVTFALLHHPLSFLHSEERSLIRRRLQTDVEIVLRGHLHETEIAGVVQHGTKTLHLAAGAAYQSAHYRKLAMFGKIDGNKVKVHPIRYFDSAEKWFTDPTVFGGGEGVLELPNKERRPGSRPKPSTPAKSTTRPIKHESPTTFVENTISVHDKNSEKIETLDAGRLASIRVGTARKRHDVIASLTAVTGLSGKAVLEQLSATDGRTRLQKLFTAHWPRSEDEKSGENEATTTYSPCQLANYTVTTARDDDDIIASLAGITGLPHPKVRASLQDAHGRTRLENLFASHWPDNETSDDETTYSPEELADIRVSSVRGDDDIIASLADVTGLPPFKIKADLAAAHGRTRLDNLFASHWPDDETDDETTYSPEELAHLRVIQARHDQGIIASLAEITGLSSQDIHDSLVATDGRTRLDNLFASHWPDDETDDETTYSPEELAGIRVASGREDDDIIASLADVTGLPPFKIKADLAAADGRTRLDNLFASHWPDDETDETTYSPDELADLRVIQARHDQGIIASLAEITGLSSQDIHDSLVATDGRTRLDNLFASHWPDDETDDETTYSPEELAGIRVSSVRGDDDIIASLADVTGLPPFKVKADLAAAHGRTRLDNLFASYWPDDETDETTYSPDELADLRVIQARHDQGIIASLAEITGLSSQDIHDSLVATDGRTRLDNLFASHWPDDETDETDEATYSPEELAHVRVIRSRNDQDIIASLAKITGLSSQYIHNTLVATDGRTRLDNLFASHWPDDTGNPADNLATQSAARALKNSIILNTLSKVTGISEKALRRRLERADGRKRLGKLFADFWPD